jgi:urea transport system permease protein
LGAVLVNYAKTYFTSGILAPYWLFMLGGLFIAVTVLLPRGIVGSVRYWMAEQRAHKAASESSTAAAAPRPAE